VESWNDQTDKRIGVHSVKITYRLAIEDLIHFNLYHAQQSPSVKRVNRLTFLIIPIVMVVVMRPNSMIVAVCTAAGAFGGALLFHSLCLRWITPWLIRRMLNEGTTKGITGEHELEISSDGVHERTSVNDRRDRWASVDRIVEDDCYIFICLQATMAHIIPKSSFATLDQASVFMNEARALKAAAVT
jgi:hypothetical protein